MKYLITILVLLLYVPKCKSQCNNPETIIQTFIDNIPEEYNMFKSIDVSSELYVIKNQYLPKNISLKYNGKPILIADEPTDTNGNYFEIVKFERKKDTTQVAIYYEPMHMEVPAIVLNQDGKCIAEKYTFFIID